MGCIFAKEDLPPDGELCLRHFQLLRSVGRGAFGKVRIVMKKDDKKLYALKYINKEKCIRMKAVQNIILERQLLEEIKCNFIVNLQFAFQDDENMFMVLDLMLGGDLRYRLDRNGPISEDQACFYAAEIALALEYLHVERIVHRDIKPDNLLLDEKGHVHLTDFNVAVRVKPDRMLTAAAGTRAYMAPEILRQKTDKDRKGYFTSVDFWSLGVFLYECLYGKRPFQGKSTEELSASIQNDEVKFPAEPANISENCKSCLLGLLERDITKRLGAGPEGMDRLRAHPWFAEFDWEKIARKEWDPPFVPDKAKVNFDATFELEEMLLEDNPLKPKARKRPTGNRISKERESQHQQIEAGFHNYSTLNKRDKVDLQKLDEQSTDNTREATEATEATEDNTREATEDNTREATEDNTAQVADE